MTVRLIEGLRWASPCAKPDFASRSRPRGTKAQGLAYERALGRALSGRAVSGLWFAFADRHGAGWCSPDLVLQTPWGVLILEAKLTDCADGYQQIRHLYRPVVEKATGQYTFGLVVVKRLDRECYAPVCDNLEDAIRYNLRTGCMATLHWLGRSSAPLVVPFPLSPLIAGLAPFPQTSLVSEKFVPLRQPQRSQAGG